MVDSPTNINKTTSHLLPQTIEHFVIISWHINVHENNY